MSETASVGFVGRVSLLLRIGTTLERWKLARRLTGRGPTLRGWTLLLAILTIGTVGVARSVHPFLAVTERVAAETLVVEGWTPDFTIRAGLEEFRRGGYRDLICTGGPLEKGEPLFKYGNFAEVGRATLEKFGAPTDSLHAVPAPKVRRDRTYISAIALREWLRQQGRAIVAINVVTTDVHARRTRLLFEKAFGPGIKIGVIAVPDQRFDGIHWWRSSAGVRTVVDETIAYAYARFLFAVSDDLREP